MILYQHRERAAPVTAYQAPEQPPHQTRGPARTVYHARATWSRVRPVRPGGIL
nr:MAG TPA: hypothetical protein [Caudoviricetes sp.]